ncbi:MAG TPA: microviridin/marinostatin family tricyclic proteinase inhibitor [Pyrinomonadaceae bacterium]|nr:microviridin/marinostatin family tricyclic proteinase inhibitor [Pyrinomonadaceae bacterium]
MSEDTDANVRSDSNTPAESLPFFARFLEGQNSEGQGTDGVLRPAAERHMTLKYPSDRDEIDWFFDSLTEPTGHLANR